MEEFCFLIAISLYVSYSNASGSRGDDVVVDAEGLAGGFGGGEDAGAGKGVHGSAEHGAL